MSGITVNLDQTYDAPPETVFAALADYAGTRAAVLPPEITDWAVAEGGTGAGTRVGYRLHATKKRIRSVDADVAEPEPGRTLVESDRNSTLTVRWSVAPSGAGSAVGVQVGWEGSGGVGGFFERRFAPLGIRRIYRAELANLAGALRR